MDGLLKDLRRCDGGQFNQVYSIMRKSFPLNEFRPCAEQKALFEKPAYTIYVYTEGRRFKAFWLFTNGRTCSISSILP